MTSAATFKQLIVRVQPLVYLCEYVQHGLVKLVLEDFHYFRVYSFNYKLARDALKELVEFNSCEYENLVATHFNCIV